MLGQQDLSRGLIHLDFYGRGVEFVERRIATERVTLFPPQPTGSLADELTSQPTQCGLGGLDQ